MTWFWAVIMGYVTIIFCVGMFCEMRKSVALAQVTMMEVQRQMVMAQAGITNQEEGKTE